MFVLNITLKLNFRIFKKVWNMFH